jgi:hypothetical protein
LHGIQQSAKTYSLLVFELQVFVDSEGVAAGGFGAALPATNSNVLHTTQPNPPPSPQTRTPPLPNHIERITSVPFAMAGQPMQLDMSNAQMIRDENGRPFIIVKE